MYDKKEKNNDLSSHALRKNRSFYFEDYETSTYEYIEQSKSSVVRLSLNRVSFVFFIFLVIAVVFGSKIIYLALIKKENYFINQSLPSIFLKRQDILDRNNNLLARNVKLYSAAIRPQLITNEVKLLINLRLIFPKMNMDLIKKKIETRLY